MKIIPATLESVSTNKPPRYHTYSIHIHTHTHTRIIFRFDDTLNQPFPHATFARCAPAAGFPQRAAQRLCTDRSSPGAPAYLRSPAAGMSHFAWPRNATQRHAANMRALSRPEHEQTLPTLVDVTSAGVRATCVLLRATCVCACKSRARRPFVTLHIGWMLFAKHCVQCVRARSTANKHTHTPHSYEGRAVCGSLERSFWVYILPEKSTQLFIRLGACGRKSGGY